MTSPVGQLAGFTAGIFNTLAIIPYTISVLRGHTRPARASWVIWTLVGALAAWSYHAAGAHQTIWFSLTYATNPLIVLLLSIKHGTGGWTRFDQGCLLGALASLALWRLSHSVTFGIVAILTVDAFGALPTARKVWRQPRTEDPLAWILCSLGGLVNLFAIERWTFALAFQPLYYLAATALITLLICRPWWQPRFSEAR